MRYSDLRNLSNLSKTLVGILLGEIQSDLTDGVGGSSFLAPTLSQLPLVGSFYFFKDTFSKE
ncbi:MAG: hypothetical protein BroJett018_38130 [Chloroflexota bacterium]|nr:hypothetical protein [Chloroflexota bacterium]GIK66019.1 MAG: hypothetical protein BroJett018_38130 [Chloroflexota bacterium]